MMTIQGLAIGEAKGKINLLCELLGRAIPPDLDHRSLDELQALATDFRMGWLR